VKTVLNFRVP